jgi:hypothetical protein
MPLIVETMFSFKGLKQPWKDRFFSVIQPEIPGIGAHGPAFLPKAGCQRSNSTSLGSRFSLEAKMISGLAFSTSAAGAALAMKSRTAWGPHWPSKSRASVPT